MIANAISLMNVYKGINVINIDQLQSFHNFITGMNSYLKSPYQRTADNPESIYTLGSAKLYAYNTYRKADPILLFIPSLINKHYILDLMEDQSLARFLAGQKINVFILAWDNPINEEVKFSCKDYVNNRIQEIINFLVARYHQPIIIAGYCMGGLLAISTINNNKNINGLILLATPWNIQSPYYVSKYFSDHIEYIIKHYELVPAYFIKMLFYLANQSKIYKKYINFANIEPTTKEAELFLAVEEWVNNGIDVTKPVLLEMLSLYQGNNQLLKELCPSSTNFQLPTLIIAPKYDTIVPYSSAINLTHLFPNNTLLSPSCGHIGMIIGSKAKAFVWEPIREWIIKISQ